MSHYALFSNDGPVLVHFHRSVTRMHQQQKMISEMEKNSFGPSNLNFVLCVCEVNFGAK